MTLPEVSTLSAPILARIAEELGAVPPALPPAELEALAAGCGGDAGRLKRWLKRRLAGEPVPYILGELVFRGRRFRIDARAYITDPESSFLVEGVEAVVDAFGARHGRPPLVAEIGSGCGSLAISLKLERPAATVVALDLDPAALRLSVENASAHRADVRFVESDLFDDWPEAAAPDIIFADPPWGSEDTLYSEDRDGAYYRAMPAASAFPLGGLTGVHAQILRSVAQRQWPSHVVLNGGVLSRAQLAAVAIGSRWHDITASGPGLSLLHCRMR
ncbi:MAG TPA: class I SAM-dependent methyltransferase [Opitutaceae bacterium]|nr:class I SAM-dependent methyltransferase [Opitutaceae bacterium]